MRATIPADPGALARAIAAGVGGVPGVAGLTPGPGVEVATYYAGGKTVGVLVRADRVAVHVVLDRLPVEPVAEQVRSVACGVLHAAGQLVPVEVVVADVVVDELPARAAP